MYDLVLWSFSVLIDLFFREVHPRGSWKIPRRGPIILVAAPHANQVSRLLPVQRARNTNRGPFCDVVRGFLGFDARYSQRGAPTDIMAYRG
jgi:hypothetical protein